MEPTYTIIVSFDHNVEIQSASIFGDPSDAENARKQLIADVGSNISVAAYTVYAMPEFGREEIMDDFMEHFHDGDFGFRWSCYSTERGTNRQATLYYRNFMETKNFLSSLKTKTEQAGISFTGLLDDVLKTLN
ncbi:MAG: hypothetical protein H9W81_13845 [Enterococcus sp.]|nr:hypothetical protein [Enterococcus sp.]